MKTFNVFVFAVMSLVCVSAQAQDRFFTQKDVYTTDGGAAYCSNFYNNGGTGVCNGGPAPALRSPEVYPGPARQVQHGGGNAGGFQQAVYRQQGAVYGNQVTHNSGGDSDFQEFRHRCEVFNGGRVESRNGRSYCNTSYQNSGSNSGFQEFRHRCEVVDGGRIEDRNGRPYCNTSRRSNRDGRRIARESRFEEFEEDFRREVYREVENPSRGRSEGGQLGALLKAAASKYGSRYAGAEYQNRNSDDKYTSRGEIDPNAYAVGGLVESAAGALIDRLLR